MVGSVKHQGRDTSVGGYISKKASYKPGTVIVIVHHAVSESKALIDIPGARLDLSETASFPLVSKRRGSRLLPPPQDVEWVDMS